MTSRSCGIWLLSLAIVGSCSFHVRADNIDLKLFGETHKVLEHLQANGAKNVGILHFRSQKDEGTESFNLGTISSSMSTRLQNALILHMPTDQPLGIARDASATALSHKVGGWHKHLAERKKLFTLSYPQAWGSATIKPDTFLTGLVRMNKSRKGEPETTTVVIESFTAKSPEKLVKLHEFTVVTDRAIVREFGQSFALSGRALAGKRSFDRDQLAVRDARRRDLEDSSAGDVTADNVCGLSVRIEYDGVAQSIRPDANSRGEWRVEPPQPGVKVTFLVRNNGSRAPHLGASMQLNGRNIWRQQTGDVTGEQIWIFDASNEAFTEFAGFYTEIKGKNLVPFKVLSPEESAARAAEFGDKVGLFNVDVFESRPSEVEDEMKISLARNVRSIGKKPFKLETLKDAKTSVILSDRKLFSQERDSALKRNLIVASDEPAIAAGDVLIRDLPKPVRIGGITIRYYDAKRSESLQISN